MMGYPTVMVEESSDHFPDSILNRLVMKDIFTSMYVYSFWASLISYDINTDKLKVYCFHLKNFIYFQESINILGRIYF